MLDITKISPRRRSQLLRQMVGPLESRTLVGLLLPSGLILGGAWCVTHSFGENSTDTPSLNSSTLSLGYTGDATAKNGFTLQAAVLRTDGTPFANITLPGFGNVPAAPTTASAVIQVSVPTSGISTIATGGGNAAIPSGSSNSHPGPGAITFSGSSTVRLGTAQNGVTGASVTTFVGTRAIIVNRGVTDSFDTFVTDNNNFFRPGAVGGLGTLTMAGDNTLGGGLSINQGFLTLTNNNNVGGQLTLNGGTLERSNSPSLDLTTFSGGIFVGYNGGVTTPGTFSFTNSGSGYISNTGTPILTFPGTITPPPQGNTFGGSLTGVITHPPIINTQPTGVITYMEGNTILGTGSINSVTGVASLHLPTALPAGPHYITANYAGDGGSFTAATADSFLLVTQGQTSTNLHVSAPSVSNDAAVITLTATTTTNENERLAPTGTITFLEDNTPIATVPFTQQNVAVTLPLTSPGTHHFSAVYSGDDYFYSSSSSPSPIVLTANDGSTPPTVNPPYHPIHLITNSSIVTHLYHDLLHRPPSADELNLWTTQLNTGQTTPAQVASAFIHSPEYRTNLIQNLYQSVLGRQADDVGLSTWLSAFAAGTTLEQMKAQFYGSQEFFDAQGGSDSALVSTYYHTFLSRDPDSAGLTYWTDLLDHNTPRGDVASGIANTSTEGSRLIVQNTYQSYLHRAPDDTGLAFWSDQLKGGASEVDIVMNIVGSPEYVSQS